MLHDLRVIDGVSESYLQDVKSFIDEWYSESEQILVKTSGSTGQPKEIPLDKERMRASARATGQFFEFKKEQVALLNLSPKYIAGKMQIVRAIAHEMILLVAPLSANPLEDIPELEIHFAAFVPSQVATILLDEDAKERFNSIKNVIIGGAPIDPNLENELINLPPKIYASFGMTETITHFALRRIGTPLYRCLDGYQISADDKSCLVVHPNSVVDEMLFTNDVIDYIDEQTFKWSGRFDNVINSGGVKIHPEKVEKMIAHLLPENRFYVTSKKDPKYGEVAVLVVEGDIQGTDLLADAKQSLPKHHAPKELIVEEVLEETPTNKIIRKKY